MNKKTIVVMPVILGVFMGIALAPAVSAREFNISASETINLGRYSFPTGSMSGSLALSANIHIHADSVIHYTWYGAPYAATVWGKYSASASATLTASASVRGGYNYEQLITQVPIHVWGIYVGEILVHGGVNVSGRGSASLTVPATVSTSGYFEFYMDGSGITVKRSDMPIVTLSGNKITLSLNGSVKVTPYLKINVSSVEVPYIGEVEGEGKISMPITMSGTYNATISYPAVTLNTGTGAVTVSGGLSISMSGSGKLKGEIQGEFIGRSWPVSLSMYDKYTLFNVGFDPYV